MKYETTIYERSSIYAQKILNIEVGCFNEQDSILNATVTASVCLYVSLVNCLMLPPPPHGAESYLTS
jgi:hypothetical protein